MFFQIDFLQGVRRQVLSPRAVWYTDLLSGTKVKQGKPGTCITEKLRARSKRCDSLLKGPSLL